MLDSSIPLENGPELVGTKTASVGGQTHHFHKVVPIDPPTAVVTKIGATDTEVTLASVNESRRGLIVKNDSPSRLYVKYGPGADWRSSFTDWIEPGATWVMPMPAYTGLVNAMWRPANDPFNSLSNFGSGGVSGAAYVTDVQS